MTKKEQLAALTKSKKLVKELSDEQNIIYEDLVRIFDDSPAMFDYIFNPGGAAEDILNEIISYKAVDNRQHPRDGLIEQIADVTYKQMRKK